MSEDRTSHPLDRLYAVIASRLGGDPATSYTAKLLADGPPRIARKLGEEATEAVIEIMRGDAGRLVGESADLLYHLLVAWASAGIEPGRVWAELARREGVSGHAEKQSRTAGHGA